MVQTELLQVQGLRKPCKICTQPEGAESLGSVRCWLFSFGNDAGCMFAPKNSSQTALFVLPFLPLLDGKGVSKAGAVVAG